MAGHSKIALNFYFNLLPVLGYLRTKQESQRLKDDGIVTFAMGIGSSVNSAEMEALASEPSHVFRFTSVRQMLPADKGLEISLALCSGE